MLLVLLTLLTLLTLFALLSESLPKVMPLALTPSSFQSGALFPLACRL